MLSKVISLGAKIELQAVERPRGSEEEQRVYFSKVYEILTEDTLEITMPMEQTKLILLQVDSEYDMVFYGKNGLYQCFARVADRYKSNNVYLLRMELTSDLRKFQRRDFYRFTCAVEMHSRSLMEEELEGVETKTAQMLQEGLPMRKSVIVDISGGGIRFLSDQQYEIGSMLYCTYSLMKGGKSKTYEVIGRVLAVHSLDNRPGTYEHRMQYYNMDVETREEIIKYIFEEERRNRKRERNP